MMFKSLMKEPFLHFLFLGSLMFFAASLWGEGQGGIDRAVIVSEADVARLEALWLAQYSREPSAEELDAIIDNHIREEVLYREAMALGLGDDDLIVRRRVVQKFLFLSEDLIAVAEPGETVLADYYELHKDRYQMREKTSFAHIYLSTQKRGSAARQDAVAMVSKLQQGGEDWRELGDPFMLQREYAARESNEIAELFGREFAISLSGLEAGGWTGPVQSAYGWHGVRVLKRTSATLPSLSEVREVVIADYKSEERESANKAFYRSVRDRYTVSIELSEQGAE